MSLNPVFAAAEFGSAIVVAAVVVEVAVEYLFVVVVR